MRSTRNRAVSSTPDRVAERVALASAAVLAFLGAIAPLSAGASGAERTPDEVGVESRAARSVIGKAPPGLERYIEKAMRDWDVPGLAIAVVKDDRVVYAHGFGVRNIETREPVTPETIFGVGSVTKSFTALSIGMLADGGKLSWDSPVRDYVPSFQTYDPYVTSVLSPRDIASHRTGIEEVNYMQWRPIDDADNSKHPTRDDIFQAYKYFRPSEPFRSKMAYKNASWIVAGKVVEAVSGLSWDAFVHERIFAPLGMLRSSTSVNETKSLTDVSSVHFRVDGKLKPLGIVNADVPGPMGSINSTVMDMAQYVRFQLGDGTMDGKRLLSAAGLNELHRPNMIDASETLTTGTSFAQQVSYALGWWVQDYRGLKLVHHAGAVVGGNANVAFIPEKGLGVVVLINGTSLPLPRAISLQALDAYLGVPSYDWNARALAVERGEAARLVAVKAERAKARIPNTKPTLDLERYTGVYHSNAYGDLKVSEVNGELTTTLWTFTGKLAHYNYDAFTHEWDERHYYLFGSRTLPNLPNFATFDIDEHGVPARVSFLNMGTFVRIPDQAAAVSTLH